MPGGTSRKRQPKAISLTGLTENKQAFADLPATLRKQVSAIINTKAKAIQADLIQRISADGFAPASVKARIKLTTASSKKDEATLTLNTKRVPFSRVKFTTQIQDQTGTRASVFVLRGGKRVQVYGFVNPYGKKQKPLIRYQKAGKQRLVAAGGIGLKQWWDGILTDDYLARIRNELASQITQELTK
ncbi:hypothetical protein [Pseudaeromonas paramecii]|uniref:HK97 gp10 family phage protein n=1 Tax=Pseudaeromonas paramecii TaxID=2138166 RepID=A0ABP8PVX4_9GAMM